MDKISLLLMILRTIQAWNWIPEDEHPCNIRRLSLNDVYQEFGPKGLPPLYQDPLVIRSNDMARNAEFRSITSRDNILNQFAPDFNVTLSSSNALSEHRRTMLLKDYLDEIKAFPETTPLQLSNESWYLFGETYTEPWQHLLRSYELPPCQTCTRDLSALSFGIGNRGSGVQWHTHGPGFSEALHGRKHWILYPPGHAPTNMHKDTSSRQWMEFEYPKVIASGDANFYECTLDPGDMIYFPVRFCSLFFNGGEYLFIRDCYYNLIPHKIILVEQDRWWHATLNLDPYTAFLSTFTTEHGVNEDEL